MKTSSATLIIIFVIISFLPVSAGIAESYSGYDYMWFNPGHYLHYTETYDTEIKDVEVVYQETISEGIFITLNFLDNRRYDSSLLGGSHSDKIIFNSGFPSSNEFNFWFLINLPQSFTDGSMWKHNDIGYRVEYIGDITVNGKQFNDVIKISINSLSYVETYLRGEGEAYLAKNIGIIEWKFRKVNGETFEIIIEDWGELPPRNISGRVTLDGRYPAPGYYIGLSNKHENDGTGRITDSNGRFSFTAYGHKLTLRYASILLDGSLDWEELTKFELISIDSDINDLVLSLGYPSLPVEINIDDVYYENERVNIGTIQTIKLHCSWAYDGTDATGILVKINGTNYYTDQTGWINFPIQNNNVGQRKYGVTYVSNCDSYNIKVSLTSPIWDKVVIPENQTIRIQKGGKIPSKIAYYESDNEPFIGTFILNDTISNKPLGSYPFLITGIIDEKHGLSQFTTQTVNVIIDQLSFTVILSDQRIDLGQEPEIAVSGKYLSSDEPFIGVIKVSQPIDISAVSEHMYKVSEIVDNQCGFTSFETNEVKCIWDRLKISSSGVSKSITVPGETETIWFKAVYEYDNNPFNSTTGSLTINSKEATWNEENERWEIQITHENEIIETFEVTNYFDELYSLSGINHVATTQTISWKNPVVEEEASQGITGYPFISILLGISLFFVIRRKN